MTRLRFPVLALLVLAAPVRTQERTHDVTPDDYASVAAITELAVSPDGKHVAYAEARWDKADDARKADLWVVPTDGGAKPTRLTGDRANDRHPKWAADGTAVYVLGNRKRACETKPPYDGTAQVWRAPLDGGDPKPVTRVEGGVAGFDYAPAADAVFYTKDATATDDDAFTKLRTKFKADYGHGERTVSEVWRLDLRTWRAEKVIAGKRYVREFAVTRDGKRVAMVTAIDDTVIKSEGESRVDVWDGSEVVTPPTDAYRAKAASPHAWLEHLTWNPDGTRFAFCAVFDAYPAEVIIGERKDGGWDISRAARPDGVQILGYGSPLKWHSNRECLFISESNGATHLSSLLAGSGRFGEVEETNGVLAWDTYHPQGRKDAVAIALRATSAEFPDLYRIESARPIATGATPDETARRRPSPPSKATRLTDVNPHTKTWKLPTVRHVTWTAPDGSQVGGVLELPHGYAKGKKLPLVVALHGGPTTASYADLRFDPHNGRLYFAAKGYAVLLPNYRGSTGYGDKFLTDLVGNENDLDVKDILAGVQHLIKEGIADPDRVAVMGWSNGGYLTNCLITLKDPPVKFRAASSGAGILDTVAEWGFNDEPAYPKVFKKGHPWETPDVYRRTSPTYGLGDVTTPTVIHVGGNDVRCPPGHSRMLYRALREYRNVPAELVVYPNEPHGLTKLSNRRAKMEWDLAWFEKYVMGK